MKKQEQAKISKEVFEIITSELKLFGMSFNSENFNYGLDMFLEGVNFIPNKTKTMTVGEYKKEMQNQDQEELDGGN